MEYRSRVLDGVLSDRLAVAGAVLIDGPKACGKTRTAREFAASSVLLDVDQAAQAALDIDPALVLDGPVPRLIDEWQLAGDAVWNGVRRLVDDRGRPGQFILTGSSVPDDDVRRHSGAGRIAVLRMRPMTLFEMGASSGAVSLSGLLSGEAPSCPDPGVTLAGLAELIAVGGWPGHLSRTPAAAQQVNRDYLAQIAQVDIGRVSGVRRDPLRIERFLRSLGRHTSTEAALSTIVADAAGTDDEPLARTTGYDYLAALERVMVIEDVPAWSVRLRSRATLRSAPKRHFVDPSLAVAALGADPQGLLGDLETLGLLFESLVVRDLRVLSQPLGATVFHARDSSGREADIVLQLPDGRWSAFEVKLGARQVDAAAASLRKFADSVDQRAAGAPAVLGVITLASYGYRREDGVAVIPVAALRP